MSNMVLFQKPEFGRVRCFIIDNQPWFVAKDVCECLDVSNPTQAIMRLDEDEKSTLCLNEGGPDRNVVNEYGIYTLILSSRKPEAKQFKRWITHDVIPSIRKSGGYSEKSDIKQMSDSELIARALIAANSTIERIEKERDAERKVLELRAEQMQEERDKAVKERVRIASKREATIMGRLGNEVKRNEKLAKENAALKGDLCQTKYMIVRDIPWVFEIMTMMPQRGKNKANVFNRLGTALCHLCSSIGIKLGQKMKDNMGHEVSSYPVEAINLMKQYLFSKDNGNYYYRMLSDYMK